METALIKSVETLKEIRPENTEEEDADMHRNLYTHIKNLLKTKIALNDNDKFDDLLEDISLRIKTLGYYLKDDNDLSSDYIQKILANSELIKNIQNQFNKQKLLLRPPAKRRRFRTTTDNKYKFCPGLL